MAIEKCSLSQLMVTGGICCTVLFLLFIYPCLSSEGEVDMIDIGQGDSMFVGAPHQRGRVLIDHKRHFVLLVRALARKTASVFTGGKGADSVFNC